MPVPSTRATRRIVNATWTLALAAAALLAAGCQPTVAPRETFNWSSQPVSLTPPPDGWRREGELSGGIRGVRFIKERSVGEAIGVGDYYALGDRSRSAKLRALLDDFGTYDRRDFARAASLARSRTDDPFSPLESDVAEAVNDKLDLAVLAHFNGDMEGARAEIAGAAAEADRLQFSLGDVLDRVIFSPERRQEPERFTLVGRRDVQIAGAPAVVVDYTFDHDQRLFHGREAYVVHANHLYVATFMGLKENLALFDRVVASTEFPP
jgi:hypothetical protein